MKCWPEDAPGSPAAPGGGRQRWAPARWAVPPGCGARRVLGRVRSCHQRIGSGCCHFGGVAGQRGLGRCRLARGRAAAAGGAPGRDACSPRLVPGGVQTCFLECVFNVALYTQRKRWSNWERDRLREGAVGAGAGTPAGPSGKHGLRGGSCGPRARPAPRSCRGHGRTAPDAGHTPRWPRPWPSERTVARTAPSLGHPRRGSSPFGACAPPARTACRPGRFPGRPHL